MKEGLFETYIGVDYSGADGPTKPIASLKVFEAQARTAPQPVSPKNNRLNWSRQALAEWLLERLSGSERVIVGIDHAFSFPEGSLARHGLTSWDAFLEYFSKKWRTDKRSVEEAKASLPVMGEKSELRLTEQWTSSARSVFVLDGQGQVGKSTHAGIPWLRCLRSKVRGRVHFWPFDRFDVPEGKSVIVEVYPSLFSKRYSTDLKSAHDRDAFAVCRWLQERDKLGFLRRYFCPLLSPEERKTALLEGWILGVM